MICCDGCELETEFDEMHETDAGDFYCDGCWLDTGEPDPYP